MLDQFIADKDGVYWFTCGDENGHFCLCGKHMDQGDKLWCINNSIVLKDNSIQFFCSKLCIMYYRIGAI